MNWTNSKNESSQEWKPEGFYVTEISVLFHIWCQINYASDLKQRLRI